MSPLRSSAEIQGSRHHALLLGLVRQLSVFLGEPVPREALTWALDQFDGTEPDLVELRLLLGPRPRRNAFYLALGDLVDIRLVEQNPEGIKLTDEGLATLEALNPRPAFDTAFAA